LSVSFLFQVTVIHCWQRDLKERASRTLRRPDLLPRVVVGVTTSVRVKRIPWGFTSNNLYAPLVGVERESMSQQWWWPVVHGPPLLLHVQRIHTTFDFFLILLGRCSANFGWFCVFLLHVLCVIVIVWEWISEIFVLYFILFYFFCFC